MDSFFGIGLFELIMIAVVALLVLGPERLPSAMREVSKWMRQLRNLSSEFQSQFSDEFKMLDEMNPRRIINEAIDPKPAPKPAAKQPPGQAAAKPLAPKPVTPAAKPPAAKPPTPDAAAPLNAAVPAVAAAVINGEMQNTILPPAQAPAEPGFVDAPESPPDPQTDAPSAQATPEATTDGQDPEASQ